MATSTRALMVAFVAVIAAFIGSTIWVQRVARGIDADTVMISRDATPGIELLSDARAELRDLETNVVRFAHGRSDERKVAQSRARLDALLAAFLALPTDAHEADLFSRMQVSIRAFDEASERVMEQARGGRPRGLVEAELGPLADAAGESIKALISYDAHAVEDAAVRIEKDRGRADRIAWELDAISALLAIIAAALALRVVRQTHQIEERSRHITERKAEELEQFASRVAHDILSPLSAVSLSLTLARKMQPHSQAAEALERGASSLQRVRRIVDGLLAFARAGASPEPGATAMVAAVIDGLVEELTPFAVENAATFQVDGGEGLAVACSSGVLLSLLGNLIRNAIKYLGDSKRREVLLRVRAKRNKVFFEVEDTGPGVPIGNRAFEPYVRGSSHGTVPGIGLGLATVKRLVDSHGGAVGLRANPKGGSIFWFELPEAPSDDLHAPVLLDVHARTD